MKKIGLYLIFVLALVGAALSSATAWAAAELVGNRQTWIGSSADSIATKHVPTAATAATKGAGNLFIEYDTGRVFESNGTSWILKTAPTAATDTVRYSAPGYTATVSVKGYQKATWYFTISAINTSVTLALQAKKGNGNWTSVAADSTIYTANKSSGLTWSDAATADSLRGAILSEAGGTNAQILSHFGLSGGN